MQVWFTHTTDDTRASWQIQSVREALWFLLPALKRPEWGSAALKVECSVTSFGKLDKWQL